MTCRYCGTTLPDGAMFCGECGRSVAVTRQTLTTRTPKATAEVSRAEPVEAAPVEPVEISPVEPVETTPVEPAEIAPTADSDVEPEHDLLLEVVAGPEPEVVETVVEPVASIPPSVDEEHLDVEATRITPVGQGGDRFVLQFSTGESVTVFGTGIIGRNPNPEPGEYFDQRVAIVDPGKSVSKTHLEFGQTSGAFWINDRFSGNGSGIRQPEGERVHCDPGKRYLVARGSRVDIGEQFFIVS